MKKIMVLSTNRADFAHIKLVYESLKQSQKFNTILTVSGSHFDKTRGESFKEMISHSIIPDYKIKLKFDFNTNAKSIKTLLSFTKRLKTLIKLTKTDYVLIMGDRLELFALCNLVITNSIKLIHLCGGETTIGVIDNYVRNTLTLLSDYHFVSGKYFKKRVIEITQNEENVFVAGEPIFETIKRTKMPSFEYIKNQLGLNIQKNKYIVCSFHPETNTNISIKEQFNGLYNTILKSDIPIVCSAPNIDKGGNYILKRIKELSNKNKNIYFIPNMGFVNYTILLKNAYCSIGNSSSIVIESPFLSTPSILIGNRQNGRPLANSIIKCDYSENSISKALEKVPSINKNNIKLKYEFKETSRIIRALLEEKL